MIYVCESPVVKFTVFGHFSSLVDFSGPVVLYYSAYSMYTACIVCIQIVVIPR